MNVIPIASVKARLLIVDDEPAHMTALYHTLEDSGYEVTAFPSPIDALEMLADSSFDLILTDLQMPGMDGISFLRAAQQRDPNLVGVVMTGHGAIETAIEAMKVGALDYVLKPFKLSTILPVLSRALEVRRLRLEIVELQGQVQQHMLELEAANKELESFSYCVSHDLRAPLRAINGFSTLLVSSYLPQLPDEAQQLLSRIVTHTDHMGKLIEHLLRFSQLNKQPINKAPVNIEALAHEVLEELRSDMPNHPATVQVQSLSPTQGDLPLLRQVFTNLLSNAFKFTRKQVHPLIVVGQQQSGANTVYFVRDNGAGFDMRQVDSLFRVFHRLHSTQEFEGTGVGLSLVQRIILRHGGRIWAEAAVNQGATFYFTLAPSVGS